jgi:hypothetical protein
MYLNVELSKGRMHIKEIQNLSYPVSTKNKFLTILLQTDSTLSYNIPATNDF